MNRALTLVLGLALLAGCATTSTMRPKVDAPGLRAQAAAGDLDAARRLAEAIASGHVPGGDLEEAASLVASLGPSLRPGDRALAGVLAEAQVRSQAAFDIWLDLFEDESAAPWIRRFAARRARGLVDRARLPATVGRASAHIGFRGLEAEASDLLWAFGIRTRSSELTDRARSLILPPSFVRRSGRTRAWASTVDRETTWDVVTPNLGWFASPDEGPGTYEFTFDLPPSSVARALHIRSSASFTLELDRRVIGRHERWSAVSPERSTWTVPPDAGGPVRLVMESPQGGFWTRVFIGHDLPGEQIHPPSFRSLIERIAHLEAAVADRDVVAAQTASDRLMGDRLGVAVMPIVYHLDWDPTLAAERSASQGILLLTGASAQTQGLRSALVNRVMRAIAEGDLLRARALRSSADLGEIAPTLDLIIAREAGERAESQRLASQLLADRPHSCSAAMDWMESHWDRLVANTEKLPSDWPPCSEVTRRRGRLALEATRLDEALELAGQALREIAPGESKIEAALLYTEALWRGGQEAEAIQWGDRFVSAREMDDEQMLDWLARHGPPRSLGPWNRRLRHHRHASQEMRASAFDQESVGLPLSDGAELARRVLEDSQDGAPAGASVEVLFQERFIRVLGDGSTVHRHHQIFRIHGEDALDRWGEVPVPDGAEVLLARTWRRHESGAVIALESEDWSASGAISLAGLAEGAIAEVALLWIEDASPVLGPAWVTGRVSLGYADARVRHARVVLASGAEADVEVETGGEVQLTRAPGLLVAEARQVPALPEEPLDPRPDLRQPWVRFTGGPGGGVTVARWHEIQSHRGQRAARLTPTVAARAAAITKGLRGERARLRALHREVLTEIQDEPAPLGALEASVVLGRGAGERSVALVALCRAAGLRCDLVLARPMSRGKVRVIEAALDVHDWAYPLVRAETDEGPVWLDTASPFAPFGYVPPMLAGVEALVLGGDEERINMPASSPEARGRRHAEVTVDVQEDGTYVATGVETLTGLYAMSWRHVLAEMTPEERRQALGRLIQASLPGAALGSLELEGLTPAASALIVRWRADGAARLDGNSARLSLGLSPENLSRATVHVGERRTPLLVSRSTDLDFEVTVKIPAGWSLDITPSSVEVDEGLVRFRRTALYDGRRLEIDKRCNLAVGLIEPEAYAGWVTAVRAIDRADRLELTLTRKKQRQ
jgi:hypothetical protein